MLWNVYCDENKSFNPIGHARAIDEGLSAALITDIDERREDLMGL